MSAAKHTPGPWRIAEGLEATDLTRRFIWSDAETREEREDQSPYCIATVNERTMCPQLDANAKLIAAAPEMAEALIACRAYLKLFNRMPRPGTAMREITDKIGAALAKAGL